MQKRTLIKACGLVTLLLAGSLVTRWLPPSVSRASPATTLVEATEIVLASNPGTQAIDVNLKSAQNSLVWEVLLDNNVKVSIDANTKRVIQAEQNWQQLESPILGNLFPIKN
jgi:uncharacterized membrane protein YkoI